jgi:hypothetical protein
VIVTSHRDPTTRAATLASYIGKRAWHLIDETVGIWDGEGTAPLGQLPPPSDGAAGCGQR